MPTDAPLTPAQLALIEHSILRNPYVPADIVPTIKQARLLTSTEDEVLFGGSVRGGKALCVTTPIATPDGWATMGSLAPGDRVFDESGKPCTVTATSGIMHNRPCYRVVFSDGSSIIADADHQWFTTTIAERAALASRRPEARAKRRATRERRGSGKRPDLAAMNARRAALAQLDPPPSGSVRTTADIAASLHVGAGRTNHSIEVSAPLDLPHASLPIDPYTLGIWLGDGVSAHGSITTADDEVIDEITLAGYAPRKQSSKYAWGVPGLYRPLRLLGLLNNKHLPPTYLRASIGQRLALLQGIVDSDGHIDARGQVEVTWTRRVLVDGLLELLHSLGIKAVARESRATIGGRDCGARWRVKFMTNLPAARLPRKLDRQKREGFKGQHSRRYIVAVDPVESRPVQCIAVDSPSHLFLAGREMIPTHNSEGLLMAACQYKQQEDSHTLVVRRNRASLTNAGALISRSHAYLAPTDATWNGSTFKWTFPTKSTITFGYLDDQKAVEQYLSAAYTDIFFEEITDIPKQLFAQLVSRASKRVGNPLPLRVFATCNPPADASGDWIREHWIRHLDADGVAQSDTFDVADDESGTTTTRRFIRASLDDNPHEDRAAYLRRLQSVDRLTRARMLGSWTQAREGKMLRAEDLEPADMPQHGPHVVRCRFWDLAATRPTSKNPDPDYTVGVLMSIDTEQGSFRVEDVTYLRDSPAAVKRLILDTAHRDGVETLVRWWRDPAQAGKAQSHDLAVMMTSFDASGVLARANKTTNFSPFAAAAGNGLVSVMRADWTDNYTGSLLSFPTRGVHDDDVDATSGAYGVLAPMNAVTVQASGSYAPDVIDTAEAQLRRMRGLPTDTW